LIWQESPPSVPLHGKNLLDGSTEDTKYIFAARDKMDETHDAMRAIRSKEYKLIHNLMPERAYCQFNRYKEANYPVLAELNALNMKGELPPEMAAFMTPVKPEFELYDLRKDPFELKNLANDPSYADIKTELLFQLNSWCENVIHDQGVSEAFKTGGWPSDYPTKSLEEWEYILELWKPWVFREPGEKAEHPGEEISRSQLIEVPGY
jgi:N-sulfoglucosamine sulfohydrolase